MAETAAVIIIGAGAMGASTAYHLAKRGLTDVLVLERDDTLGDRASTTKAAGGIRHLFSSEVNIRLSQVSIPFLERFEEETGSPFRFHQLGYLLLAYNEAELDELRRNAAFQRRYGVAVEEWTPQDCRRRVPAMYVDDLAGAVFGPKDGYGDPYEILQGFVKRGRELGVRYAFGRPVTGLLRDGDRVVGVETPRGPVSGGAVVICCGAWSAAVGRMAGVDIPIRPYRRDVFVTGPFPRVGHPLPMVIEYGTGFYYHSEGEALLFGMADKDEPPTDSMAVRWPWLPTVLERLTHRLPPAMDAEVQAAWAGLYEVTPDAHPIIGPIPQAPGLYIAAGYSGHGVMHSPATGIVMAELLTEGRALTVDISPLSITRFGEGKAAREQIVI